MSTMRPPSVVIVHSRPLLGEALACLLTRASGGAVSPATDTDSARRALRERRADVVLIEADAATRDSNAISTIRREAPQARLLLLADSQSAQLARWSLDAGVDGVVLITDSAEHLVSAVGQMTAGQSVFPCGWMNAARQGNRHADRLGLSGRQLEVLELLASGASNEDIARSLGISPNTVKFHIAAIYARLGVHTRVEAAAALSSGAVLAAVH